MKSNENLTFEELRERIPRSNRGFADAGIFVFFVFFVLGGIWVFTAQLESAVIASGSFVATGANKVIQHLEGGIVKKILVHEGDRVSKGQVLVRLDKTKAEAEYARLFKRKLQLDVYKARLEWELAGKKEKFTFSLPQKNQQSHKLSLPMKRPLQHELLKTVFFSENKDMLQNAVTVPFVSRFSNHEINKIIKEQQEEFIAGLESRSNQVIRLRKQVRAEKEKITGLRNIIKALVRRKNEINSQIRKKRILLKRGLTTRRDLDNLVLTQAQDQATLREKKSNLEQSKVRILELLDAIKGINLANREEKSKELRTTNAEISDIEQRLIQAQDTTSRVLIRAPVDGVIVELKLNTEGGVISSGQQLAVILPTSNVLQIQAQVAPTDIDDVAVGQEAMVQLSALNQRTTPMFKGRVTYVSADLIQQDPEKVGRYVVRVNLANEDLVLAQKLKAVPGMPVAVFIKTGSQTYWEYLTRPIVDSLQRAAKEK